MRGINQVHYIGSITQAPDMKYTPGGLAILEVTVAGKQQITTADGAAKTVSFYNRCKAFGSYAEALAESLQQGDVVSVHGRLDFRSYEGEGGKKRSTVETVITTLQTLEGKFVTTDDSRGQPVLSDGLNTVTIGGNLTKDAELSHTPTGNSVARLNVAVNERYGDEGQEKVGFFDLQGWGQLAEALGNGSRGQGVVGVGRLLNESWEDGEGQKRYATKGGTRARLLRLLRHHQERPGQERDEAAPYGGAHNSSSQRRGGVPARGKSSLLNRVQGATHTG